MKKAHFQVYKVKSNKKKQKQKLPEKAQTIEEEIKPDTIYNFYNNINISSNIEMDESTLADIEYAKTLQLALKDAIKQNEKIKEDLNKFIEENKKLKEEIEEKDNVIYELSQYYQFCQNNHLGCDNNILVQKIEEGFKSCKKKKCSGNKKKKNEEKNNCENSRSEELNVKRIP